MNLPNDIHLKIEKSPDKEDILLLLARLENDGVTITNDVYAAIVATLEYTKLGAIEYISPLPRASALPPLARVARTSQVGSFVPASKGRTHGCADLANVKKALANSEPCTSRPGSRPTFACRRV